MGKCRLSKADVAEKFASGISCSQCVLGEWADELGYSEDEMHRIAAAFGGGMFRGDTCGAVTGALMALGIQFGDGDSDSMAILKSKIKAFQDSFTERFGSTICRDMLGYDMSVPGEREKAVQSGKLMDFCPNAVIAALEILDDLMEQ